jgi:SIR2-like domain
MTTPILRYDPVRVAHEVREQMAPARRRMGFLLGAGTSMAATLPGISDLTTRVANALTGTDKTDYERISGKLGASANIENILDRVRLIRELIPDGSSETFDDVSGTRAKALDIAICQAIFHEVREIPLKEMGAHLSLASWIRHVRRDDALEIFTTNYDLLIEYALEATAVPYFDGFVGAISPFFVPECVEADGTKQTDGDHPPSAWTRLWKLHGSVGWEMKKASPSGGPTLVRTSSPTLPAGAELVIYPSRDKLLESRRLPFATYMERLHRFLGHGESLLIVAGYSFRDEHINGILTQALRSNTRLAIVAFMYGTLETEALDLAQRFRNFSAFGANAACIGGIQGDWIIPGAKHPGEERPYWDETKNQFVLGDFRALGNFLDLFGAPQNASAVSATTPPAPTPGPGVSAP